MKSIKILLIHRSRLIRECLTSVLQASDLGEIWDCDPAMSSVSNALMGEPVAVAIVDFTADCKAGGRRRALVEKIRQSSPEVRLVALLPPGQREAVVEALAARAQAYLLEDSSVDELVGAILAVDAGKAFCSPVIVESLVSQFADMVEQTQAVEAIEPLLTHREREVLGLVSQHLSNREIARRLSVSIYTVKNHVHNILEKLRVGSRFEAVELAHSTRMIAPWQ